MKQLFLFASLFLVILACRKKDDPAPAPVPGSIAAATVYDTLEPRSYYPVYPGSYWNYLRNDSDTITYSTLPAYQPHWYVVSKDNPAWVYSDTVNVPFLKKGATAAPMPIYGYDFIVHYPAPFGDRYGKHPLLSEVVGQTFTRTWTDTRYGNFNEHLVVGDKFVNTAGDSVLLLKGHWVYGPNANLRTTEVYVKNIGLYSHVTRDTVSGDTILKLELLDYFINN